MLGNTNYNIMRDPAYLTVPWFDVPKMSTTFPLQLPGISVFLETPQERAGSCEADRVI